MRLQETLNASSTATAMIEVDGRYTQVQLDGTAHYVMCGTIGNTPDEFWKSEGDPLDFIQGRGLDTDGWFPIGSGGIRE